MKKDNEKSTIGVFCHIYYSDLVTECMEYLEHIPAEYDLYISYSLDETGMALSEYIEKHNISNCVLRKKSNRGRDVSSLLVTFRKDILQYDFFCFLHDKKSIGNIKDLASAESWRRLYFDCLLYDKDYIENIIIKFMGNPRLGVLTSPQPFENEFLYSFGDEWLISYDASVQLGKMIEMNKEPSKDNNPITLGTAFWARTRSLEKLLKYSFTYEDFPEEPMKSDGQLGHAVERMVGLIAEDAGYTCETIMPDHIAQRRARDMELFAKRLLSQMRKSTLLKEEEYLDRWYEYAKEIHKYCLAKEKLYIYGAGFFGEKALTIMENIGVHVKGIVVSDGFRDRDSLNGVEIFELSEIDLEDKDLGIVIAAFDAHGLRQQMQKNLEDKGYYGYLVLH